MMNMNEQEKVFNLVEFKDVKEFEKIMKKADEAVVRNLMFKFNESRFKQKN